MVNNVTTISELYPTLGLIALMPLIGSALTFLVGLKNRQIAPWIATLASFLSFIFTLVAFKDLGSTKVFEHLLFSWIQVGQYNIDFLFRFDQLTAVMTLIITGIGTLIHIYSTGYMAEDESKHRFFSYLNLFLFSMLLLVLGGNLLVLFVGWEGVGLCSYLLIGFWYKEMANARAGRKAFVVNRIGDAGFLIGMFLILMNFGTLDFVTLKSTIASLTEFDATLFFGIAFSLFIGATGKSAQIPLFVWLPDAMAGPTPVSALIHAATMVTAGIYMMCRLHFLFGMAPEVMGIIAIIAVITAFVAGTTALCQNDIKKVLAYSTVSQLGFMFMAASSGAYWVAVFHLMTHAFFKACLFLGAGSVIHGCHHEQDMRHMGGLWKKMPVTFITYLIATLAIAGIAPLSGYYSKHAILSALNGNGYMEFAHILGRIAEITAAITAFYMGRSLVMTFFGTYRGHAHPHESPLSMVSVLGILAVLSAVGGCLGGWLFGYLGAVLPHEPHFHEEGLFAALAHSWVGIVGVLASVLIFGYFPIVAKRVGDVLSGIRVVFANKYFFDELYQVFIVKPLEVCAEVLFKRVDQNIIDAAVNGTGSLIVSKGEALRRIQTSQISHYALSIFVGGVFILVFYVLL